MNDTIKLTPQQHENQTIFCLHQVHQMEAVVHNIECALTNILSAVEQAPGYGVFELVRDLRASFKDKATHVANECCASAKRAVEACQYHADKITQAADTAEGKECAKWTLCTLREAQASLRLAEDAAARIAK